MKWNKKEGKFPFNNKGHFIGAAVLGSTLAASAGATATTLLGTALGVGGAFAAKSAFTSLTKPAPVTAAPPPLPAAVATNEPSQKAQEIEKAATVKAQKERLELARRKRTGTILTSPQGLLTTTETVGKSLLGG